MIKTPGRAGLGEGKDQEITFECLHVCVIIRKPSGDTKILSLSGEKS